MKASSSFRRRDLFAKKDRLQVVEKAPAQRRGPNVRRIARDQPARYGLHELALDPRERIAGSLGEERGGHTVGKPQRVEHELEADIVARHRRLLLYRAAFGDLAQISFRLLVTDLPHDPIG